MPSVSEEKMNLLVDTHTHLADAAFDDDRTEVIERARKVSVGAIITVTETLSDADRALELGRKHRELKPALGLYPTILDEDAAAGMMRLIEQNKSVIVAIGEVGLDYWKVQEKADRFLQQKIFLSFIDLAIDLGLPLNVHSRSAGRDTIALLLGKGAQKVQMHAFGGKWSTALPGVEAGFFFSIPASAARSRQKQKLVKRLPLESLLLETDSPVLGLEDGIRNEPSNLLVALDAVAAIKELRKEFVAEVISENVRRLYGELI